MDHRINGREICTKSGLGTIIGRYSPPSTKGQCNDSDVHVVYLVAHGLPYEIFIRVLSLEFCG